MYLFALLAMGLLVAAPPVASPREQVLRTARHPGLRWPDLADVTNELRDLYAAEADGLFWYALVPWIGASPSRARSSSARRCCARPGPASASPRFWTASSRPILITSGTAGSSPTIGRWLRERLRILGEVAADAPAAAAPDGTPVYDAATVAAVKRFQARHILDADGVIGAATIEAVNVPLARRVRQIELAMERGRWLPRFAERLTVFVNVPLFRLWASDPVRGDEPLRMNVVVGKALRSADRPPRPP